ncbi:MAG: tail fiber domain-containing protein, partial [Anaerolineaceae bacterium]
NPPGQNGVPMIQSLGLFASRPSPNISKSKRLIRTVLGVAIISLATVSTMRAVTPAPDGGYAGGNTAEGTDALFSLTTGTNNVAIGFEALHATTSGSQNSASGGGSLHSNTTGNENTATGINALFSNIEGQGNTATGASALYANTFGGFNTAIGFEALLASTIGNANTACGAYALTADTIGFGNTAMGDEALAFNTTGNLNVATGFGALDNNTIGSQNTASGYSALRINSSGNQNTATGVQALLDNTTGDGNIALGFLAGSNLTTGNNNIDIGAAGKAGESNAIRIGKAGVQKKTYIQGIFGTTVPNGSPVRVDAMGHLGTMTSSARFKDEIKPMDKASEALLALEPVTFRYKPELDPDGIPQFGLVAEQVEKVNADLVVRDSEGKVNTVRYEAINAMLLNEFLKEHRKVEEQACAAQEEHQVVQEQQQKLAGLESALVQQTRSSDALRQQVAALTAGLQKVSARVELSGAPTQVATNVR